MVYYSNITFSYFRPYDFVIINVIKKIKLFQGHMFSNAAKIMLIITDTQYYVPVKLCRTA